MVDFAFHTSNLKGGAISPVVIVWLLKLFELINHSRYVSFIDGNEVWVVEQALYR